MQLMNISVYAATQFEEITFVFNKEQLESLN